MSAVLGIGCGRWCYLFSTTWIFGGKRDDLSSRTSYQHWLLPRPFVFLIVEIYAVVHWQGTSTKLAVFLVLSRITRRGPRGRVRLNAKCLWKVAIWDPVQWKLVTCL